LYEPRQPNTSAAGQDPIMFMMFIAVPGLIVASFMATFILGGLWEAHDEDTAPQFGMPLLAMLLVVVCTSLILIEPAAISPAWLQYTLLLGLPALGGFVVRRIVAARWSRGGQKHTEQ
jgi:hypothetical protein